VTPRYGEGVVGGSEAVAREAAHGLAGRGYDVEILTTCARNHYTWENEFEPGVETDGAVTVRRFPTVQGGDLARWMHLQSRVLEEERPLDDEEELAWVNGRFRVPDLYFHLARSSGDYGAIVFSPYLFWSTLYCAGIAPERSVLMPCLHDEPYASLRVVRAALAGCAIDWFLSEPEHQLGHRLAPLPRHDVIGAAVDVPERYDVDGFREKYGIERPFVLYAGRREDGKGWRQVLGGFGAAVLRHRLPFDLVTFGVGDPAVPAALDSRVIDLGYLPTEDVPHAFAAAEAYLQPSANESFSRTIMEAWLAGTLVIANGASEVVSWHLERSGAGLSYFDELELGECLRFVAEAPKVAEELAGRGRDYVLANYTWPGVLDAMERSLGELL